jgi:hypothetical protein
MAFSLYVSTNACLSAACDGFLECPGVGEDLVGLEKACWSCVDRHIILNRIPTHEIGAACGAFQNSSYYYLLSA